MILTHDTYTTHLHLVPIHNIYKLLLYSYNPTLISYNKALFEKLLTSLNKTNLKKLLCKFLVRKPSWHLIY